MLKTTHRRSLLLLVALASASTFAQSCPTDGSGPEKALRFLETAKSTASVSDECIERALHQLYRFNTPSAIAVLTRYLDFERPLTPSERHGVTLHPSDHYPAVDELFAMGTSALPALIDILGSAESSNLARRNALRTVMLIYRADPPAGVALLAAQSNAATDIAKARLLHEAAYDAVGLCPDRSRTSCQIAAENDVQNQRGDESSK